MKKNGDYVIPKNIRNVENGDMRDAKKLTPHSEWMIRGAKARAKRDGLAFDLTVDDIVIPYYCPVLGIPINPKPRFNKGVFQENSPSIDRIDNTKGYTRDNIIIVSYRANRIKNNATIK